MSSLSRKRFLAVAAASGGALVAGCGGEDDEAREREARTAADRAIVGTLLRVERVVTAFWDEVAERDALAGLDAGDLARDIARNERTHVEVLERYARRLGGAPPERPAPRFREVFAAGEEEILRTGAGLANLSAAAYLGQANRIQDRNLLASVLAIHSVEGRQAAALNALAGDDDGIFPSGSFADPLTSRQALTRLRRFTA